MSVGVQKTSTHSYTVDTLFKSFKNAMVRWQSFFHTEIHEFLKIWGQLLLTYGTYLKLDEEVTRLYPELSGQGRSFQTQIDMCHSLPGMTLIKTPPTLNTCCEVLRTMVPAMRSMFPLVEALVRVLLVNPASSDTAERSLSSLRV